MELKDFLERFGSCMDAIDQTNHENIDGYSFSKALENFSKKICEEQRYNCMVAYKGSRYDEKEDAINNAPMPKIEEF